jgi:hypothetical protein
MTDVYLLEGPDKNRYRAVLEYNNLWLVRPFAQFKSSEWWKTQCPRYSYWGCWEIGYTLDEIKSIFNIVAETRTESSSSSDFFIIYD